MAKKNIGTQHMKHIISIHYRCDIYVYVYIYMCVCVRYMYIDLIHPKIFKGHGRTPGQAIDEARAVDLPRFQPLLGAKDHWDWTNLSPRGENVETKKG